MFRVPLVTSDNAVQTENFWNAVFLYHTSPHVINRRILGISQLYFLKVNFKHDVYRVKDILKYTELDSHIYRIKSIDASNINESIVTNLFDQYGDNFSYNITNKDEVKSSDNGVFVSIRILLPRNVKTAKCIEVVIFDKENLITTFLTFSHETKHAISPLFPYEIELDKNNLLKICVFDIETAEHKASEWLADSLFPKLMAWTEIKEQKSIHKSLSLISAEKYCNLYHELKLKYGEKIIKNWSENTDPLKFVYEDVAIATYLLLLWEKFTSKPKQKFVDLGCGNGLLVYILTEEGHEGYGIDVRPRKIWKLFGENTKLKVETIIPSPDYIFPDTDWIIGNHSDELTPWIPVLAARSSKTCNFFLLPCCSYEFNGKKYQRLNSSQSQYQEYLDYVKTISDTCGFDTKVDRLRIPSTKRICFVGVNRKNQDTHETDEQITKLINNRCGIENSDNKKWVENYEARSSTEQVRNCTKLDRKLTDAIIKKVVDLLLLKENYVEISTEKHWNQGNCIHLSKLVNCITSDELKQLKNECGGLQTLLKNHHYVFLVKNGSVQLRRPTITSNQNKKNFKKTQCWFFKNHPDGCPLDTEICSYIH